MTITIISLLKQPLIIELHTEADRQFIFSLFRRNERNEIYIVQIADAEFRRRLSAFDNIHRRYTWLHNTLKQIPINTKFILLVDCLIKETLEFEKLSFIVARLNGLFYDTRLYQDIQIVASQCVVYSNSTGNHLCQSILENQISPKEYVSFVANQCQK